MYRPGPNSRLRRAIRMWIQRLCRPLTSSDSRSAYRFQARIGPAALRAKSGRANTVRDGLFRAEPKDHTSGIPEIVLHEVQVPGARRGLGHQIFQLNWFHSETVGHVDINAAAKSCGEVVLGR